MKKIMLVALIYISTVPTQTYTNTDPNSLMSGATVATAAHLVKNGIYWLVKNDENEVTQDIITITNGFLGFIGTILAPVLHYATSNTKPKTSQHNTKKHGRFNSEVHNLDSAL